jgi:2-phospho-L-lactate guanylyltransferase
VSCWAIVAINTRLRRKRRLREALDTTDRDVLARRMLGCVLEAVEQARLIEHVLVVSPDDEGLPAGYEVVHDTGTGLNAAFELARAHARVEGADELVLLPADLPHLTATDVDALVVAGRHARIAIAPDRHGIGTNGLYISAMLDFPFRFGVDSRARHAAEARARGIEPAIVMRDGLAADLDTPADLHAIAGIGDPGRNPAVCSERPA